MKLNHLSKLARNGFRENINIYGIGLPRTGTNSLAGALNKLGINGENYCVLHNHKQEWNPCQHNNDSNDNDNPFIQYKFYIENNAYQDIEQFVDEKLSESMDTKFILTHRANKELWTKSVKKIEKKLNHNYAALNIPDPALYKKQVFNYFKANNILDNLLILDLFQQHEDDTKLWIDIGNFLGIDIDILRQQNNNINVEAFPHINMSVNAN